MIPNAGPYPYRPCSPPIDRADHASHKFVAPMYALNCVAPSSFRVMSMNIA